MPYFQDDPAAAYDGKYGYFFVGYLEDFAGLPSKGINRFGSYTLY
jgi:hypothetical protein